MTEELYYTSAYISEFVARAVSCRKVENEPGGQEDRFEVVLDKTAFFPEQGGQGSDIGVLEFEDGTKSVNVVHVRIDEGGCASCDGADSGTDVGEKPLHLADIKHITDSEIPVGCVVHGVIDWKRRFSNMQQHTGEHIFSGLVNSRFGYDNVGFHLSDSEVTMDYNGAITAQEILEIERRANEVIWDNLEVLCEFPDGDRLKDIPYRSKKELTGDVRIVTIPGVDICACCAPHVDRTGEIGILKVVGLANYKGGVRVNILCGKRAMEYLQSEHEIVSQLSGMFTTSSDNVVSCVKKLSDTNSDLKAQLSEATGALIEFEVKEIDKNLKNVVLIKDNLDNNTMRKLVNLLTAEHSGYCAVFAGNETDGYRYIVGCSDSGKDCREVATLLREKFGAKGGGSNVMIQGSLQTSDISVVSDVLTEL